MVIEPWDEAGPIQSIVFDGIVASKIAPKGILVITISDLKHPIQKAKRNDQFKIMASVSHKIGSWSLKNWLSNEEFQWTGADKGKYKATLEVVKKLYTINFTTNIINIRIIF